jgi:hypothetical protein
MVFVADEIPGELRRVIEFLNKQMSPAEVLGIEIRQYVGGGLQTLVPSVIGQTAETQTAKGNDRGPRWSEETFFNELSSNCTAEEIELARNLLGFGAEVAGRPVDWGAGKERGSFTSAIAVGKDRCSLFSVYTTGGFSMQVGWSFWKFEPLGMTLCEDYRLKVKERLGLDFDQHTWQRVSTYTPLSMLLPDRAEAFKGLIRELAHDFAHQITSARATNP